MYDTGTRNTALKILGRVWQRSCEKHPQRQSWLFRAMQEAGSIGGSGWIGREHKACCRNSGKSGTLAGWGHGRWWWRAMHQGWNAGDSGNTLSLLGAGQQRATAAVGPGLQLRPWALLMQQRREIFCQDPSANEWLFFLPSPLANIIVFYTNTKCPDASVLNGSLLSAQKQRDCSLQRWFIPGSGMLGGRYNVLPRYKRNRWKKIKNYMKICFFPISCFPLMRENLSVSASVQTYFFSCDTH